MNKDQRSRAEFVGRAIARDVLEEKMAQTWTGLDPQDADQLTQVGLVPDTTDWCKAEMIAEETFWRTLRPA